MTGLLDKEGNAIKAEIDSLSKIISSAINNFAMVGDSLDTMSDKTKGFVQNIQKAVAEGYNPDDIAKELIDGLQDKLEKQGKNITIPNLVKELKALKVNEKVTEAITQWAKQRNQYVIGVKSLAEELSNQLMKPFEYMTDWIEKIPGGKILSKMFGFDTIKKKIQQDIIDKLSAAALNGKVSFATIKEIGVSTFKSIGAAVKTLFMNPLLLFIALLIGALYVAYKQWNKIVDSAKALRTETGLTGEAAWNLTQSTKDIAIQFTNMGVSMEVVGKATAALINEFQTTDALSHNMMKNASLMVGALGVAPDVAAKTLRVFKNMGIESGQATTNMIGLVSEASALAGVAPSAVFKDLAESSKEIYTYFKGNVVNAAKAAIELRRMGTSLKEAAATSKNLLDFESNITAELEASVLAGTQLDFSGARYLAFTGKLVDSQQAVLDQIEKIGNFNKMNVIQKEAIAKASGMELDTLENMIEQRKEIRKMDPAQKKSYDDSLAALEKFRKGNKIDLIQKNQQLLAQEKMKKSWEDIILKLSGVLFPLFESLYDIINSIADAVQSILSSSAFQTAISVFKAIGTGIKVFVENLGGGVIAITALIGVVFLLKRAFGNLFSFIGSQFSKFGTMFKGTKTGGILGKIFGKKEDIADLDKTTKPMKSIGERIKDFFKGFREIKVSDILKFALVLAVLAGNLYLFGLALKGFNDVDWDSVFKGLLTISVMVVLAKLLKSAASDMLVGAIGLAAMAGALYLFGLALEPFKSINWDTLAIAGVAIVGFAAAIFALGAIMLSGVGALLFAAGIIGIIALAGAIAILGASFVIFSAGKSGMDAMIDGIARLGALGSDLFVAAAGIGAIGIALAAFGGGSVLSGIGSFIGNFLGGDPIEKMERLAAIGPGLNIAAQSIQLLGASLNNLKVPEIENIDELSDIAEASLKIQNNKQTNVNVSTPKNDDMIKKLDMVIEAIKGMQINMDGKKVGEIVSNATPQLGRA